MPFDVMAAVKWLAGLALAALLFFGGLSCGVNRERDNQKDALQKSADALIEARDQLRGCATSLNFANDQSLHNAELAAEAKQEAEAAVAVSIENGKNYARRLGELEAEVEAAKADPVCKEILERTSCALVY